jgi:hypothetical protein
LADKNFRVKAGISIGTSSFADLNRNIVTGIITANHAKILGVTTIGIVSATNGQGGMGIVTFQSAVAIESGAQRITIAPPSQAAGFVSSYNLTLPSKVGTDGQVLTLGPNGVLGFNTAGLYEARYYVSAINGSDSNDGRSKPFATIKKAAQAASFRSFQLPGGRYLDAGNLLAVNKSFIVEEAVSFLEFNYYYDVGISTTYSRDTFKTNAGKLIDALVYDLSYGGNSKTVSSSLEYWQASPAYTYGEQEHTLFGYEYIKFITQYIINNQTPPTLYQTAISQSFDFSIINDPENSNANYFHTRKDARNLIVNNRQEIIDKSLASVAIAHSDFYFPGELQTNLRSRYYDSYRLIQQNRQTIISYSYAGITSAYPSFVNPNPDKCQRDLGYFIDAVSTDVFTGGNNYSREFVLKYFTGVGIESLAGEEQQTIYAFQYAGTLMKEALTNGLPIKDLTITADPATGSNTSFASCSNVQSNVDNLVGIVTTVIGAGNTSSLPAKNEGYFAGITTSCNVICESIGIGSTNILGARKCARDLGYIVDAIAQDISYGSNQHIVYATKRYFNGVGAALTTGLLGEEQQSITAFQAARDYSKKAITNQLNYKDLTIIADVATGFNTDPASCANIQTNIDTIVGILTVAIGNSSLSAVPSPGIGNITDCADVRSAVATFVAISTSIIGIGTTASPIVSNPTIRSKPVAVFVEAGDYTEDNPIILYEDVAILGDDIRNTIIRPQNAGKDLFRVRNGCYVSGFAMKDNVDVAGVPKYTFDNAVAFDDPSDALTDRTGYAIKTTQPIITRSPYVQNCSILSFLAANGILVDGSKVTTPNTSIIPEESENPVIGAQPQFGKSMVAAAFTMVSFGGIGWRTINDGYAQVVSCFQIFCKYGSLVQSGGYLSITNSATNFGLIALRATGFSQNSFLFDRGRVAATGTIGGLQTLKVVGLGRSDQDLYVLRFFDNGFADKTSNFKPVVTQATVNPSTGINTATDTITIIGHPFVNGDTILYIGDENSVPNRVVEGLVSNNQYYLSYIDANNFRLYEDNSLTRLVDLRSAPVGINTFQKGNLEFFAKEITSSHTSYQLVGLGTTAGTPSFVSGRLVTQTVTGGTATGYAVTYSPATRELLISVEQVAGIRRFFGVTGSGSNLAILDHSGSPISIAVTSVTGLSTYYTVDLKVDSTTSGTVISGIASLTETYYCHFHRPSIINSSGHTWEYSGSGTDYNALPQNGGKTVSESEQVSELGGRSYSSGTNELGDFKIGNFITAYNRTGNIIFNNKVTIGQLDSLKLSLSGGVSVEEFSIDTGLGDNEIGGAQNFRVSTQLAIRSFLNNRLGNVIDKNVTTNSVPSSLVQLNSFGQINADLIPPKVVNYYTANVSGGRTDLVNKIPAVNLINGDTIVEPGQGYVLISDVYGQFLILSSTTRNYNFNLGNTVISTNSAGGAIGIVTAPPSNAVGYGTTGLVKGVLLGVTITSGGSGYTNPGVYTCVLDNATGIGTSARAAITVGASGSVTSVSVNFGGRYYTSGDILTINSPSLIGGRSGGSNFTVSVSSIETRLYLKLINNQKFQGSAVLPDYVADNDAVGVGTSINVGYGKTFNPTDTSTGGSIDFTNSRIIVGVSTFTDGDPITYSSNDGNVLVGLLQNNTYYTKRVGISSIELYNSYSLSSKVLFTGSGTGTHTLTRVGVNTVDSFIVFENHGFSTGDAVKVSGEVPTGITTGNFYFVGSIVKNAFTLHTIRADSVTSVNGAVFNPVGFASTGPGGTMTFTKQNVTYSSSVNTSSNLIDNWTVLASGVIDAASIVSGTITPSRLGSGSANSETFLRGDSVYSKVITSVGIGTTQPITVTSTSSITPEGGVGIVTYFGNISIYLNRASGSSDTYSNLGVAKFRTSTFSVSADGEVQIKNSATGDVDAVTLGGQSGAYYLDPVNFSASIPVSKGGTGLSALPPIGSILQGNGTSYDLVTSPTLSGTLTLTDGGNLVSVGAAITNANITGFGTVTNLRSTNAIITGISTFSGTGNNINQTAGTASLNRLVVTGITTVSTLYFDSLGGTSGASIPYITNTNIVVSGIATFTGTENNINCTSGTQIFNRAVFSGITTFLGQVNVGVANYTTATIGGTLQTNNFIVTGLTTSGRIQCSDTVKTTTLDVSGVSTVTTLNLTSLTATDTATLPYITNTNTVTSGISTFTGTANNIQQINGTAALNRLTVAGVSTFTSQVNYGTIVGTTLTNTGTAGLTNQTVSGISTFSGTANNIQQTNGTAALNRLTVAGVSTFSGQLNVETLSATTLAGNLQNALTITSPLTGSSYNNSAAVSIGINATSANTANYVVQRGSSGEFTAGEITATGLNLNGAGSPTSAQLNFNGTTNNWINFSTTGVAAPTFITRSVGTKIVLYEQVGASSADYGFGIESNTLWSSVPGTSSQFKWYGGTTLAATLTGAGVFTATGTVSGTQLISRVATGTAPLTVTSTTQVSNLNVSQLEGYVTATANTGNTIVLRNAQGNFSAGTITATAFSGSTETLSGNLSAWNTTTPGLGLGGLHLGAASGTSNVGPAITFGARDSGSGGTGQAGIYINSDGTYGTRMYIATTDSYASGSKVAISISESGVVNFIRARPTYAGNIILDANNYNFYAPTLTGTGASGTWAISVTGNAANVTGTVAVANGGTGETTRKSASSSIANFGQLEAHGTYTDANAVQQWGGTFIQSSTNTPNFNGNTQHYQMMLSLGSNYDWGSANVYAMQMCIARNVTTPYIGIRYKEGGVNTAGWGSWQKISAGYSDSAGSATSATNAVNLSTNRTNWSTNGTITAVVGQLSWKNYGNNHTIFDASQSTSPDGTSVNNTNSGVVWTATYPTLMGWNGTNTYGVRVDSSRASDTSAACTGNSASATTAAACSGNSATATNISNNGTVTLATATETNSITITQPSYTTNQPVKLLNFDWYGNTWSFGNIRSGSTPSNGFGIYFTGTEKLRIGTDSSITLNGTLNLNNNQTINTGPITPYGVGGSSGWTRSLYAYSFGFQETGAWSNPYPDLVVQYHTGITLAANNSYEGIRFKADYNNDTLIFQVNGASNYLFKYQWLYTNATGFYSDTNGWHIHPNELSSYGGTALRGSRNGWRGIHFYDGGNAPHVMFDGSANGGFYYESTGRWSLYYAHGNASWGVNTSTTSASYAIYTSGNIFATGTITAASDFRKKTQIETVTNALEKVNQLRGVTYKRTDVKEDEPRYDKVEMGVIAQEVEPILPEVVTYASDVDEYAVSYGNFAGLFIEAFKEQTAIINNLKKEIEELKSKLGE